MRARAWIGIGGAAAVLLAAGLVFKPWLLFVDVRVDDVLPSAAPHTSVPSPAQAASPSASPTPETPTVLAAGSFTSHEHQTTGSATIIRNPDASRVLAIENLATSSGPDVHVWLRASDVVEGRDGWYVAGSADFVDLGPIKGNLGNQLYEIPADIDLSKYRSVSLWCVQFAVSFGAAPLT